MSVNLKINKIPISIIISIVTFLFVFPPMVSPSDSYPYNYELPIENNIVFGNACRYNIQGWIYVHIEGDSYERGYQQGYLLSPEIIDMIYRWSNIIHINPFLSLYHINITSEKYESLSKIWWNYCKKNAMNLFWESYPSEYKQEIFGIADGVKAKGGKIYNSDVNYEDILTLNEMYELMTVLVSPVKGYHPLKTLFNIIKEVIPSITNEEEQFINSMTHGPPSHHCNGFIAVGDATENGQVIAANSVWCGGWWFSYYVAQRWNIILDIEPKNGHRIVMSASPGYIWSDANYYQTDAGLILIDTTAKQGLWSKKGLPLSIRSRTAAQYSEGIDDAIYYLLKDNNGIWTSIWLLGDLKTGEIARFELGLYNYALWRTFNGFYWSANNPIDPGIRREQQHVEWYEGNIYWLTHRLFDTRGYEYYIRRYKSAQRDESFEEFGEKNYGKINVELVQNLMSSMPISEFSTDCKITDTNLIKNQSLLAFWGHPGGEIWETYFLKENLKGVKDVPPAGWVKIDVIPDNFKLHYTKGIIPNKRTVEPLWSYKFGEKNYEYCNLIIEDGKIFSFSANNIYAFNTNGKLLWQKKLEGIINDIETDDKLHVITDKFYYLITFNGKILWLKNIGGKDVDVTDKGIYIAGFNGVYLDGMINMHEKISDFKADFVEYKKELYIIKYNKIITNNWEYEAKSQISNIIIDDNIFFGDVNGNFYCLDFKGNLKWKFSAGWSILSKPCITDKIYFGSLDGNFYCLEKDGSLNWIFSSNGAIHSDSYCYGEFVFFGSDDGFLYALNKTTGHPAWNFSPAYSINGNDTYNYITTPILANPVSYNGTVFISAGGKIYALNVQTSEWVDNRGGQESGNLFILSNISYPIQVTIIIIGCITLLIAIRTYKQKKKLS